jgi:hypothetical protein
VGAWIEWVEDHPQRHRPLTLFILDVCYAGEVAVMPWHGQMNVNKRRAWVLAATGPREQAFGYRLSRALVRVLEQYRDGELRSASSVRYIPAATVWRDIETAVVALADQDNGLPQAILTSFVPGHADLSHLPFFLNPAYGAGSGPAAGLEVKGLSAEIARLTDWAVDPLHFMRRAGGAEPVDRCWQEGYFSGRVAELSVLSRWLDDEKAGPSLRIVTGRPGAGKSALLAVVC